MRSGRRHQTHLLTVILCLPAIFAGCGDGASEGGDRQIMRWGGDLLGGGGNLSILDSIPGDVIVAGGQITFSGAAGGDYLGAGGRQEIGGRITGNARVAGSELMLMGEVAKNVTAAGGQVVVGEGAVIRRNVYIAGQTLRVAGAVDGSLRAVGQEVVLDGTVTACVGVMASRCRISSSWFVHKVETTNPASPLERRTA